jgi:predicted nucleic acid-binding protein
MILADTSVWVEHLRNGSPHLVQLLEAGGVFMHPFIMGEIALGHLKQRRFVLDALAGLPQAMVASDSDVMAMIERHSLHGIGIGYVDVQLLASARQSSARLWTLDRRLKSAAVALEVDADP